jgi:antirestriction protein ArdC
LHRVYTVFNAQQIDGIPAQELKRLQDWEVVKTGEEILQNSGATIAHDQQDRAFYSRAQDSIHLPAREAFRSAPDYYGTALHELAHWTGHPSRLNRQTLNESYRFGEMKVIERMKELRATGLGFDRIAEALNAEGIMPRRGKKWWGLSVNKVLSRVK